MNEKIKIYGTKFKDFLSKVPKKIFIIIAVVLVFIAAAIVAVLVNRPYAVLVTGSSSEEVSAIMSYLEAQGVTDYRLENGDTILVPKGNEANLKAKLLMEGYPKSGFSYSTYYDNVSSLSTESERNFAYLTALQERMGAVIRCMDGVKDAVVTIAQGEDHTYVLDSGNVVEASASVLVTMRDGGRLTNQQAAAIRNLVARAVQGLEVDQVEISDTMGNRYTAGDNSSGVTSDASDLKLRLEEENNNKIRTNIMQVLIPLFGEENVKVGVNCVVDVNHTVQDITDVSLPEWAEDGSTEGAGIIGSVIYDHYIIRGDEEAVGGVVGTTSNADLPEYVEIEVQPEGNETEISTSGQIDYDNDRSQTHVERTAGYITDCTVAVSINSTTAGSVNVEAIRAHVARAAGINAVVTQDLSADEYLSTKISILPMAFYNPAPVPVISQDFPVPVWILAVAGVGLLLLIVLLVIVLIIVRKRARKKRMLEEQKGMDELLAAMGAAVVPGEPVGADVMALQTERSMELRKEIRRFVEENPEISAQMVKVWLRGGDDDG